MRPCSSPNSYMGELGKGIHELTTIKLSDRKVQEFINEFFPLPLKI